MHILYKPTDPNLPSLSVFLQQNTRSDTFDQGVRYRLTTDSGDPVLVWCDDNLIYYLFCTDSIMEQTAAQILNAPDLEKAI